MNYQAKWEWYFKMSLLETIEIVCDDEVYVDWDWPSTFGAVIMAPLYAPGAKESFPICFHRIAQ